MALFKKLLRLVLSSILFPLAILSNKIRPGIRILMYHRVSKTDSYDQLTVSPERFEDQVRFLAENYRIISLADAFNELRAGTVKPDTVVLTFDDGYRDNLSEAKPILDRYQVPAIIFITTEFCDQKREHPRYKKENQRLHLTWDEVKSFDQSLISIGSHTITHPYLRNIDDNESSIEIKESKRIIEEKTGKPVDFFCYPSGNFGARELKYVKAAGYKAAVTVSPGKNRPGSDLFLLKRTEITQKDDIRALKAKLTGSFDLIHQLLDVRRQRIFSKTAKSN